MKAIIIPFYLVLFILNIGILPPKNFGPFSKVVDSAILDHEQATPLCEIDGEAWDYDSVKGLIFRDSFLDKRLVKITFTKRGKSGLEQIILEYSEDTGELIEASITLKKPGKSGKIVSAIYRYDHRTKQKSPESVVNGAATLANNVVSGTASLANIPNLYGSRLVADESDAKITVSNLSFEGVTVKDLEKELAKYAKKSN